MVFRPRHEFSKQCESVGVRGTCTESCKFLRMCTVRKDRENGELRTFDVLELQLIQIRRF